MKTIPTVDKTEWSLNFGRADASHEPFSYGDVLRMEVDDDGCRFQYIGAGKVVVLRVGSGSDHNPDLGVGSIVSIGAGWELDT